MPFGFWVLGDCVEYAQLSSKREVSQMPFGFWVLGDAMFIGGYLIGRAKSQMPFGFWVLGDVINNRDVINCMKVSNAFRLLGSGGHK